MNFTTSLPSSSLTKLSRFNLELPKFVPSTIVAVNGYTTSSARPGFSTILHRNNEIYSADYRLIGFARKESHSIRLGWCK